MTSPRARMPRSGVSEIQVLRPTGTMQVIDVLATNVAVSNAVATNVVRISTTVDICYDVDTTPVAVGTNTAGSAAFLPAGGVEYVKTIAGTDKIAVIAQDETTAGGYVYVTEME